MFRSLAARFDIQIFDRVRKIKFHGKSQLTDVDLTAFSKLEQVAKPIGSYHYDQTLPRETAMANYLKTLDEKVSVDAAAELQTVFSTCQIMKIEHDQTNWTAEIDPSPYSCGSLATKPVPKDH